MGNLAVNHVFSLLKKRYEAKDLRSILSAVTLICNNAKSATSLPNMRRFESLLRQDLNPVAESGVALLSVAVPIAGASAKPAVAPEKTSNKALADASRNLRKKAIVQSLPKLSVCSKLVYCRGAKEDVFEFFSARTKNGISPSKASAPIENDEDSVDDVSSEKSLSSESIPLPEESLISKWFTNMPAFESLPLRDDLQNLAKGVHVFTAETAVRNLKGTSLDKRVPSWIALYCEVLNLIWSDTKICLILSRRCSNLSCENQLTPFHGSHVRRLDDDVRQFIIPFCETCNLSGFEPIELRTNVLVVEIFPILSEDELVDLLERLGTQSLRTGGKKSNVSRSAAKGKRGTSSRAHSQPRNESEDCSGQEGDGACEKGVNCGDASDGEDNAPVAATTEEGSESGSGREDENSVELTDVSDEFEDSLASGTEIACVASSIKRVAKLGSTKTVPLVCGRCKKLAGVISCEQKLCRGCCKRKGKDCARHTICRYGVQKRGREKCVNGALPRCKHQLCSNHCDQCKE